MNINQILKSYVNDKSVITLDVHHFITVAFSNFFKLIFKADSELSFVHQETYVIYSREVSLTYMFKYGRVSIDTVGDRLLIQFTLYDSALKKLNVPLGVKDFSVSVNEYLDCHYIYFTRQFNVIYQHKIGAVIHFEQRHYQSGVENNISCNVFNSVNPQIVDLHQPAYDLAERYFNHDEQFMFFVCDFLSACEQNNVIFEEVFSDYMVYLQSISNVTDIVQFLNFFHEQYSHSFETLKQNFIVFDMKLI